MGLDEIILRDIIRDIGGIATSITAIIALLAIFAKPFRVWILKMFGSNKLLLSLLRHEITGIYYKYLEAKKLPTYERENLMMMANAYFERGGNSYVKQIVEDMLDWEVYNK